MSDDVPGDPILVYCNMVKVKGEVWVQIESMNQATQEVMGMVSFPLSVFDNMVLLRDQLVRDAREVDDGPSVTQGAIGMGG